MLERCGRGKITAALELKPAIALAAFSGSSLDVLSSVVSAEGVERASGFPSSGDAAGFVFSAKRTMYW